MNFFRSRVIVTFIGLIVVGGISVGLTIALSSQSAQTALVGVARSPSGTTTTGAGTRVATSTATRAPTATATTPASPPSPRPTATQGSQLASMHGILANPNASAGTFVVNMNGSPVTIVVTTKTTYSGVATSMNTLTAGLYASVRGTMQADGTFLAVSVRTWNNTGN